MKTLFGRIKRLSGEDIFKAVLVSSFAFLVYANSLSNGFVMDDKSILVDNPVLGGSPAALFSRIDTTTEQHLLPYYRPFTYLTYWVENKVHGLEPFYVRLFNLILHSVNAFAFFYLARLITGNSAAALMAGLLFAVHPINAEAVDFNSGGRNTMLATFFVITAYILYKSSVSNKKVSMAAAGGVLFLAGMLSKEFAICLLPFILAEEVINIRKKEEGRPLNAVFRILPFIVATGIYLLMRWSVLSAYGIQDSIIPGFGTERLRNIYYFQDLSTRLLNNLYIIPMYLFNILFPIFLSPKYHLPEDITSHLPVSASGFILIILGLWFLLKKNRPIAIFGLSWIILFWLPVSGLVIFSSDQMADRYLYAPALGLWIICADTFVKYYVLSHRKALFKLVAVVLISAMSVLTFQINRDWRDDLSIFSRIVRKNPDNPNGYVGLGGAYYELGMNDPAYLKKAEDAFKKAMDLTHYYESFSPDKRPPMYLQVLSTKMGNIRFIQSDLKSAIEFYSRALMVWPSDLEARINRAMAYERIGKVKEAIRDYEIFLGTEQGFRMTEPRLFAMERLRALTGGGRSVTEGP